MSHEGKSHEGCPVHHRTEVTTPPDSSPGGDGGPSRPLTPDSMADLEQVGSEVIVDSSACSTTCGQCRVRRVKCLDAWRCGLTTLTVREGSRLEINCLGEVMQAMGPFSWRVSWRYARGVITSDDRLFSRLEAPSLDRVVLEPTSEKHAGTYRCDVQDWTHRRGKRAYWGVRVLPPGIIDLAYPGSPAHGARTPYQTPPYPTSTIRNLVLVSLGVSASLAGLTVTGLYWVLVRREPLGAVEEREEPEDAATATVTGNEATEGPLTRKTESD
ncbi:unnamed protein product [Merluccius merluccius]